MSLGGLLHRTALLIFSMRLISIRLPSRGVLLACRQTESRDLQTSPSSARARLEAPVLFPRASVVLMSVRQATQCWILDVPTGRYRAQSDPQV